MHDKLTRRELVVVGCNGYDDCCHSGPDSGCQSFKSVSAMSVYVVSVWTPRPRQQKTKNALRLFFLQRFVLEKFNSSGGVDGGVQGRVAR